MVAAAEQARTSARPGLALKLGFGTFAVLAGLLIGAAAALGMSQALVLAATVGPFLLILTLARPQWAAIIYVLLVYTNALSVLADYHGLPPLARFGGVLVLAAALAYRLVIRHEGLVGDDITWWVVAYGLMVALGYFYARSQDAITTNLIVYARDLMLYLVVINMITTRRQLRVALMALLAVGTLLATITVYQSLTGNFNSTFGGFAQSYVSGITENVGAPRPTGPITDPNYYGETLVVLVPLALYLLFNGRSLLARSAGLAAAGILVLAVVYTYSRGEALALGVVLVAAIIYKRLNPLFLVGAAIAVLVALPLLPQNYTARLQTVIGAIQGNQQTIYGEESIRGRAGALQAAIAMFADHPLIGVGRENFKLYEFDYVKASGLAYQAAGIPPHNLYLEVAAEHGVMGIIIFGGLLVMLARALVEARRRFKEIRDGPMAELTGWIAISFLGYLSSRMFLHGAYPETFWLLVSFIVVARQIARAGEWTTARELEAEYGR